MLTELKNNSKFKNSQKTLSWALVTKVLVMSKLVTTKEKVQSGRRHLNKNVYHTSIIEKAIPFFKTIIDQVKPLGKVIVL